MAHFEVFVANKDYDNWTLHSSNSVKDLSRKEGKKVMKDFKLKGKEKQVRVIRMENTKLVSHFVYEDNNIVEKHTDDS